MCQNISACLKLNRSQLVIVYGYIIQFNSASFRVSKLFFYVSKYFRMSKTHWPLSIVTLFSLTQLRFVYLNFSFLCQNISACLKLNRSRLAIAYCYIIHFYSASLRVSKLFFYVSKYFTVSKTQQTTDGHCLLYIIQFNSASLRVSKLFFFMCQNISACLKLNRSRLAIVYCYIIQFNSALLHVSKLSFRVSKYFSVSKTQQITVGHCLLLYYSC